MSSQAGKSEGQKSRLSDLGRERLLDIQKREQLKGLLVNKFKLKYGNKPNVANYINNEVSKFLKNDRLTEENLKKLDDKISKEAQIRDKQESILDERRSEKNDLLGTTQHQRPQTQGSMRSGTKSVKNLDHLETKSQKSQGGLSVMSGASKFSKKSGVGVQSTKHKDDDVMSFTSSKNPKTEQYSEIDEDDEWTAILKFNTLLHYEEQKQAFLREQERKRLIKLELEKQLREKEQRKKREKDEDKMYEEIQKQHIKLLEEREHEKNKEMRNKIMQEKDNRDKQLQEEKYRRKKERKEEYEQEVELVKRLHSEMEQERALLLEKKRQERDYLQRMLIENEKNQKKQKDEREKEKQQDIQAQQEYTRMLEKQELDRLNEFKARERRAQEFMNKMADTVIKQMDEKQNEEDAKIRRYEMERELRERMEDERRWKNLKDQQSAMKTFLFKQLDEKKHREQMEKALNDEQAIMWKQDKINYEEEERRLQEKIKKINLDNAQFLQQQVENKRMKERSKMNRQEFLLNKPILREINQKKKEGSIQGGSSKGAGDDYQHHI